METRAIAGTTEETSTRVRERYGEMAAYLVVARNEHRSEKYVQVLDEDGEDLHDRRSSAYHEDIAEPQQLRCRPRGQPRRQEHGNRGLD